MARKRKTRAAEAAQEPESVQSDEPELESEPGQDVPEETRGIQEGDAGGGGDEVVGDEEQEGDEEEQEGGDPDTMEEQKDGGVETESAKTEQQNDTAANPPENAVSENGGEAKGGEEEEEDDDDDEPVEKLLEPFSKDQLTLLIKEAVAKYPDLVEEVHKLADADPAHRKIFVHGLGWEANSETITTEFGKYGEIEDCKVVKDKNSGKSKGYGFILFKHRAGAKRALKKPQKMIEGRMTSCQLASAGPVHNAPPAAAANVSMPPQSEYTQRKIYVSNVSAELDPKKLLDYFSTFGEIEDGPLGLDKQTGKPRGFCLFVYKSLDSAKKALEEPHKNFEGHTLHCQKAIDGPKQSKGFFNQQHQQHHHQGNQGYYHHSAKKGRYSGNSGSHSGGHLMAPSGGPPMPSGGFNPAPAAIGQAVAALLATQGGGLGIGNLLGAGNPQGGPPMMNNPAYGGGAGGYGSHPGMQGGYGGQPQMGPGGVRPHQGPPYMGPR